LNVNGALVPLDPVGINGEAGANDIDSQQLRMRPFFRKTSKNDDLFDEQTGSQFAADNKKRFLAEMLPATTLAAGRVKADALGIIGTNFDMQSQFKTKLGGSPIWPSERMEIDDISWRHSDVREVSYLYIYELFNDIVKKGELKK
ncbi:MAG: hypothetical protein RQ824_05140, partial [bacterium]|nr:hypothetical protein [bacterium]